MACRESGRKGADGSLAERLASTRALAAEREDICRRTRTLLLRAEDLLADALIMERELVTAIHGRLPPEIEPRPPVAEAASDA